MRQSLLLASVLVLASSLSLAAGCVSDDTDETASLQIPLVQPAADGGVFRLRDATFEVGAPDGTIQSFDGDVEAGSILVPLAPARYSVRLLAGWTLEHSTDGTTFTPVQAIIGNQNPQFIQIFPDTPSTVSFRFYVRDTQGQLTITFGVVAEPQQLFGIMSFEQATGVLAQYTGLSVGYANYFDPVAQTREVAADGSKQRRYFPAGIAAEFFNDPIGLFAGPIGAQGAGGSIVMVVRVKADGTQELTGTVTTFTGTPISFGPASVSVGLDTEGFPLDQDFATVAAFTLTGPASSASGTATVHHSVN